MARKYFAAVAAILLIAVVIFSVNKSVSPKSSETLSPYDASAVSAQKITVYTIGRSNFADSPDVSFILTDWSAKALKTDAKFILIADNEAVDNKKREMISRWIKEKRVVLFYGSDVDPLAVKNKFGISDMVADIPKSDNIVFHLFLFGYGYSFTYGKNMPLFMGYNTADGYERKITDYLFKKKDF